MKAVGPAPCNFGQILVLQAVYELLYHHGCGYAGIVHVGEEYIRGIAAVHHEGREHLHLVPEEYGAPVAQREYGLPVHDGVLAQPEMAVRVDDIEIQILDCHFLNSFIIADATAREAPVPPSAARMSA